MVSNSILFSHLLGEDFQNDEHIFQMGWFNHQPRNVWVGFLQFICTSTLRRPPRLLKDWTNLREALTNGDGEKFSLKEQQKK